MGGVAKHTVWFPVLHTMCELSDEREVLGFGPVLAPGIKICRTEDWVDGSLWMSRSQA